MTLPHSTFKPLWNYAECSQSTIDVFYVASESNDRLSLTGDEDRVADFDQQHVEDEPAPDVQNLPVTKSDHTLSTGVTTASFYGQQRKGSASARKTCTPSRSLNRSLDMRRAASKCYDFRLVECCWLRRSLID